MFNNNTPNYLNNPGNMFTTSTIESSPLIILTLLEPQLDNFPSIQAVIKSDIYKPSSIFIPQVLKHLDNLLSTKDDLILELYSFIDLVNLYSIEVYGDSETYISNVINSIANNRVRHNNSNRIAEAALDEYTFNDFNSTVEFLNNNRLIVSFYLFSMMSMMFFKE